jgi:hypothetical protein
VCDLHRLFLPWLFADPQGGGIVRHYSDQTLRSLALVDEEAINYELLASLVTYLVAQQQEHGPRAVMQVGWLLVVVQDSAGLSG